MKLKVPPVFVISIFGLLMYLVAKFLPVGDFQFTGQRYLIMALCIGVFLILISALFGFYKAKTSIDPREPSKASELVTGGVYKYSRNPMYLAMLLVLLAWGLWLGNAFNTILAAGFVSYMNAFQIMPEEKALTNKFGKSYIQYTKSVRRWF
ncbi:methyltransferase family protein [Spongiimicrobium salis]|uniref:methyltransferase family protein n=1 Tax=Spongiimicrobium salis TaxID=1667022 RepID=UPI00374D623D